MSYAKTKKFRVWGNPTLPSKSKILNHAGDTTYKTQIYPNIILTKTVNVKVYQNTKIDTQIHIADNI